MPAPKTWPMRGEPDDEDEVPGPAAAPWPPDDPWADEAPALQPGTAHAADEGMAP